MGRSPCCDDKDLKKGPWSEEEDQKLTNFIRTHGHGSWRALPRLAGLNRCGKSCRLRWTNYLRPDIKRGRFTEEEENLIINSHKCLGNKWSAIAQRLPGRTDNEIKNYWNTHLRKKLLNMGIDPVTHQPRTDVNVLRSLNQLLTNPNIGGLWDNALRLQVDVTQLARMQLLQSLVQALSNNVNAPPPINFSVMNPMGFVPLTQNQQAYDDVLQRLGGLVNNTVPDFGVSSQPSNNLQTVVNAANIDFDVKDINITNEVGASPEIVNGKEHVDAINDDFGGANPSMYSQFETWDTLNFDVQYNDQYCIMDQYSQPDTCLGGDTISYDLET